MPGDHALLSPSAATRWIACPPSARLSLNFPETTNDAADEGTLAHLLGEFIILLTLGRITRSKYNAETRKIFKNRLYAPSMLGYCKDYAAFVLEAYYALKAEDPETEIFIEVRLDLSMFAPESFGTSDVIIASTTTLHQIDLKYGKGVRVEADDNSQCKVYALGAIEKLKNKCKITHVISTIYQPRLDNISTWEVTTKNLYAWATRTLIPQAKLAFAGKGAFQAGEHCRFCKVVTCRARAEKNQEAARYDFAVPATLTADEIADILETSADTLNWLKALKEYALKEALAGEQYPGFKLVYGRSNRVIGDEAAVAAGLLDLGYSEDEIYKRELLTITGLEGLVGSDVLAKHFSEFIVKPKGSPTLVPASDNRPGLGQESAKNEFAEPYTEPDDADWEALMQ